jgi:hypothetical protein
MARNRGPRHAFSNRPWGPNGYVRSGRRLAAPKRPERGKAAAAIAGTSGRGGASGTHADKKAPTVGRRAQRKAKRSAAEEPMKGAM